MPPFFPHGPSKPRGPLLVLSPNSQALSNTSRKVQLSYSENTSRQLLFK